jgi:hypothetical protein
VSYLRYLCLFPYNGVHHVLCFCFVCLRLAYPMLPVSLNCPFVLPLWYSLTFILYNYSMLMRSIHDFITLTKKNNIDTETNTNNVNKTRVLLQTRKLLLTVN